MAMAAFSGCVPALLVLAASAVSASEPSSIPRLGFAEAVELALAHNTQAVVAQWEIQRADGMLAETRAGSLPTLNGNVSFTRLDHDRRLGAALLASENQLNANLQLVVPLMPAAWGRWDRARTNVRVAHASDAEVKRTVAMTTARAYLAVITEIRLTEVAEHAVDRARAHYEFARTRYEGGVGNRLDQLRADQEYANSEARLVNLVTAVTRAREVLGVLVGADGPRDVDPNMQLPQSPTARDVEGSEERRQDVRAAQLRLRAAHEAQRDNWLDFLPNIFLVAQPFTQNPPTSQMPHYGWQAQALLTMPFYDGGARYGQHQERLAAEREAQEVLDNLLRQQRSEVRVAFESLKHAEDALVVQRRAFDRASDSVTLSSDAYRAGAVNNLEVVDAERVARDAESGAIIAEDAVRQARLDLLTAVGQFP